MTKIKNSNTENMSGDDRDTRNEQRKDATVKRIPMHSTGVDNLSRFGHELDLENYHYRRCADYGKGKIDRYLQAGYEFVEDNQGKRIKEPGGDELWLMRIPKNFWDEDQEAKRDRQIQVQVQQLKKQAELAGGSVPEYLPTEQNVL